MARYELFTQTSEFMRIINTVNIFLIDITYTHIHTQTLVIYIVFTFNPSGRMCTRIKKKSLTKATNLEHR